MDPRRDETSWIEPSPDFAERVLAAVEREGRAPAPTPFPWRRLALGAAAILLVSAVGFAAGKQTTDGLARAASAISLAQIAGGSLLALVLGALVGLTSRLASR